MSDIVSFSRPQLEMAFKDFKSIKEFEKLLRQLNDTIALLNTTVSTVANIMILLNNTLLKSTNDLGLLQYNTATGDWETDALPWVDIDFPIIIRTTGANIPTLVTLNGNITMPQWAVNAFNVCESQELVHGWKEGSEVFWHLHLTTNGLDATARYVKFEVEYGYADVNGVWVFPATLTTADLLIPANTPSKTMMIMSLGSFTPPIKIGGHVVARLRRIAAVGAAPTANPWIPMLQLHIQLDTLGSRTIGAK